MKDNRKNELIKKIMLNQSYLKWEDKHNRKVNKLIESNRTDDFIVKFFEKTFTKPKYGKYPLPGLHPDMIGKDIMSYKLYEEIIINPEKTYYDIIKRKNVFFKDKIDYVLIFDVDDIEYVIFLMFFKINGIDTYHIIFTTREQYVMFRRLFDKFIQKGHIDKKEFKILQDVLEKETNNNHIIKIMKRISFILNDFYDFKIPLSLKETDNEKKINLYRNIIKDSFTDLKEETINMDGVNYYLYFKK